MTERSEHPAACAAVPTQLFRLLSLRATPGEPTIPAPPGSGPQELP